MCMSAGAPQSFQSVRGWRKKTPDSSRPPETLNLGGRAGFVGGSLKPCWPCLAVKACNVGSLCKTFGALVVCAGVLVAKFRDEGGVTYCIGVLTMR